jgi:hypothetical protein
MDPNATLETIRQALRYDGPLSDSERLEIVRESFESLDSWLSAGNFTPYDWRNNR